MKSWSAISIFHLQIQIWIVKQTCPDDDMVVGDGLSQWFSILIVDINAICDQFVELSKVSLFTSSQELFIFLHVRFLDNWHKGEMYQQYSLIQTRYLQG